MIPRALDFSSKLFDPYEALHSNKVPLPYPKAKTYNNIAEYYSRTFLKKGFESNKLSKKQEKPRERNYDWYYDTLGLSEYQRNYIESTKKIKKRKGKKPVSIVTVPSSPLRSERVTVCKSDFNQYCRRKYRSLNITSAIMDIKSKEFEAFPSNSTSESSVIKTDHVLPLKKRGTKEFLPSSFIPKETESSSSLSQVKESEPPESPTALYFIKTELPSEPPDLSDDSCPDDILILKMKSNLQKGFESRNIYKTPVSFHLKQEPVEPSSNSKHVHIDSEYLRAPHQTADEKVLSKVSTSGYLNTNTSSDHSSNACNNMTSGYLNTNTSSDHSSNACNNMKSSSALNNSERMPSSEVRDSCATVDSKKNDTKKRKKCNDDELKSSREDKISKHLKKTKCIEKESTASKENSSANDSKSNVQPVKNRKKSALKSQENMLDSKKLSTATKIDSKSKRSKIKTENSAVVNHCACKFPCGLSHLCTCGYYANAKEALSKFKIPRKKK